MAFGAREHGGDDGPVSKLCRVANVALSFGCALKTRVQLVTQVPSLRSNKSKTRKRAQRAKRPNHPRGGTALNGAAPFHAVLNL